MFGATHAASAGGDGGSGTEPHDSPWADRSCRFDGAASGPLAGLTYGAKDIFEVHGNRR